MEADEGAQAVSFCEWLLSDEGQCAGISKNQHKVAHLLVWHLPIGGGVQRLECAALCFIAWMTDGRTDRQRMTPQMQTQADRQSVP